MRSTGWRLDDLLVPRFIDQDVPSVGPHEIGPHEVGPDELRLARTFTAPGSGDLLSLDHQNLIGFDRDFRNHFACAHPVFLVAWRGNQW